MPTEFDYHHDGFCDICERQVTFHSSSPWFRDFLKCPVCDSVPRERALMTVLKTQYPKYKRMKTHESSPCGRGVSAKLQRMNRRYSYSHYFPNVPLGELNKERGERCESLESLTFDDNSFDLFITQDVMEHVLDPAAAFREIARVLKPGGAHIFSVPLVKKMYSSEPRAVRSDNGTVEMLKDAEFHGNPVDENGSLVTMDWGYDILSFIYDHSGLASSITLIDDVDRGIKAEYNEIIVSVKR